MNEEAKVGLRILDIDDEEEGILAYAIDGKITEADAAPIWERFEAAKANDKKIRIYAEMSGLPSASGTVIVEKLKHLSSIMSTMEKMAIVGDAGWMGIYTRIADPLTKFDIKHFSREQKDEAVAWIRE